MSFFNGCNARTEWVFALQSWTDYWQISYANSDRGFQYWVFVALLAGFFYRYLWSLPLVGAVILIPGSLDDFLVNIILLLDVLMIFGASRRCLHDLIAGSKVVRYIPGRQHIEFYANESIL